MRRPGAGESWSAGPGAEGEAVGLRARAEAFALQDGELVLILLRPGLWRLALPVLAVVATMSLMAVVLALAPSPGIGPTWKYGILALASGAAIGWFAADWWSHAYILTSRRVVSRVGVVYPMHAEAPLSAVRRVALARTPIERALGGGSVVCLGSGGVTLVRWGFIANPIGVQEAVLAAVRRYGRGDASGETLTH